MTTSSHSYSSSGDSCSERSGMRTSGTSVLSSTSNFTISSTITSQVKLIISLGKKK